LTTVYAGLGIGALYSLVAIGYNVVLLASGVFNFAFAQILMLATFLVWEASVGHSQPIAVTVAVVVVATVVLCVLEDRIAIRPLLRGLDTEAALITTVGVSLGLEGLAIRVWGTDPRPIAAPLSTKPILVFGGYTSVLALSTIGGVIAIGVGIHFWTKHSMTGLASLASAENRMAAGARGVNVRRLNTIAFVISGVVAGGMALLVGSQTYAVYSLGDSLALLGFVAIAIGGSGSQIGGLIGGFLTGVIYAGAARYLSTDYAQVIVFGVFLVLLMLRPRGLFSGPVARTI
jgi:branched-chain amino acid transport system permease protein